MGEEGIGRGGIGKEGGERRGKGGEMEGQEGKGCGPPNVESWTRQWLKASKGHLL